MFRLGVRLTTLSLASFQGKAKNNKNKPTANKAKEQHTLELKPIAVSDSSNKVEQELLSDSGSKR